MNLNNVDLNKIRVFHVVVKAGSYQAASEELGLTRSAISQSISTLEAQLGVRLFLRKGRRLFPTSEARILSGDFGRYQGFLHESLRRVQGEERQVEGLVRIGAYYEFAKVEVIPLVGKFCQLYPEARFQFTFESPSRLSSRLEAGQIDLSFSIFRHKKMTEIESLPILKQDLVLVVPKKWYRKAQTLEGLLSLPVLEYYNSHQLIPQCVHFHYDRKIKKREPKIYAASAEILLEMVSLGLGLGVVPRYLLEKQVGDAVKIVKVRSSQMTDFIWMNQFVGQFENSAHKKFYKFVRESFLGN